MAIEAIIYWFSASVTVAVAVWLLIREKLILPTIAFGLGLVLFAAEILLAFLGLQAKTGGDLLQWSYYRLMVLAFAPGIWVTFAVTYSRGNYMASLRNWSPAIGALLAIVPALAIFFPADLIGFSAEKMRLRTMGQVIYLAQIVGATAVLMNVERTFRAAVGVMRWQIKFVVIGIATLFLTRVYTSTQVLVYSALEPSLDSFNALALVLCSVLTFVSVTRAKSFMLDLYPSSLLLYRSFALGAVGVYLVGVGFLAQLVRSFGMTAFPVRALFLLVALVLLGIVLLSDQLRLRARQFLSRHLRRPVYDVRKVWKEFSERVAGQASETELSRATVKWLSQTFETLSVTVWVVPANQASIIFGASTSLTEEDANSLLKKASERVPETLANLRQHPEPLNIDTATETWVEAMRAWHPAIFVKRGGHRICVPVTTANEVVALIMLGDRVAGRPFSVEEMDLIKCVADQVARDLLRLRLSEKLLETKEMQAFQTMATFFVHDLKNTAWTLSLLVQNLQDHFNEPAFREEAVRAVSKSVSRINDLISRIGSLREEFHLNRSAADLGEIVRSVLKEFDGMSDVSMTNDLQPVSEMMLDTEQLKKVIRNLLVNAKEAAPLNGKIHVGMEQQENYAVLTVRDNGCGMSEDFLKKQLFRPFQTTKKKGIGIGMFQSKMIVEAHRGRIMVDSRQGQGTTFRILMPLNGDPN